MTPEQRERKRARDRDRRMMPEQRERERRRAQRRAANMTPEQRERKRAAERQWRRVRNMGMTLEQWERRREQQRVANMSPEQRARKREWALMQHYRITAEQRDALAIAQGCACACCGDVARLVVDHDHVTGRLRALLCHSCNTAIGLLKDDPARAIAAAEYLARYQRPVLALVA